MNDAWRKCATTPTVWCVKTRPINASLSGLWITLQLDDIANQSTVRCLILVYSPIGGPLIAPGEGVCHAGVSWFVSIRQQCQPRVRVAWERGLWPRCERDLRHSGDMWHCTCVTPVDVRAGNIDCVDSSSGEIAGQSVAPSPEPPAAVTTSSPSTAISSPASGRLKALEDEILERSLKTVEAALHWEDIEPDATEPPREWVEALGVDGARKRFRVAKAAWMDAKCAPVGLGMARTTAVGIMKVRSQIKAVQPTLNINFVTFQAPMLDVIDVEGEEK